MLTYYNPASGPPHRQAGPSASELWPSGFVCFAHRGASGHEPENTLPAIEKSLALGAPWIEIDVFAVEDEIVVIHDARLETRTNGTGRVTQRSLAYLRSLDAGKGQQIPLLREVLDLVKGRAGLNVELKGRGSAGPVVKYIHAYNRLNRGRTQRMLLSSFLHAELVKVRSLAPEIPIGALGFGLPPKHAAFAQDLGAVSVHTAVSRVNRAFVHDAHRRGLKVFVYTVNDADTLRRVQAIGADGVFTDYPERVLSACR